jgi:hypothetical protein
MSDGEKIQPLNAGQVVRENEVLRQRLEELAYRVGLPAVET